jgi:hypothetical protein
MRFVTTDDPYVVKLTQLASVAPIEGWRKN